ncbi:MAG TPA: TetR/AcrR family transcriptional regulator [Candidatus Eisenbacteria bacterium]|nr:TetR/AcrR family transcriptional regulator [Candidatus Eisenbacteria bacterium]
MTVCLHAGRARTLSALATSRRPKGHTRRAAIIVAAEQIFAEQGYDRARLEDVAQRVGVRRASLVYYFKDKAELYATVLDHLLHELFARYQRVLVGGGPIEQRIEGLVDVWVDFVHHRPALLRILLREMADGVSEHSRPVADSTLPPTLAVIKAISEGHETAALRTINPLHLIMTLAGTSAFLLLGQTIVAPLAAREYWTDVTPEQHHDILLTIMRRLLGTRGPRSVSETKHR